MMRLGGWSGAALRSEWLVVVLCHLGCSHAERYDHGVPFPAEPTDPSRSPAVAAPVLIFDGDCGFCTSCANWIGVRLRGRAAVVPWQRIDVARYGLALRDVQEAAWWIDGADTAHRGHRAVGHALRACGGWWRVLGWLCLSPPTSWVAAPIYRLVSRYRHRMPGGTPACRVPTANKP